MRLRAMKKWEHVHCNVGSLIYEKYTPENFYVTDDGDHIFFHRKCYNIIDSHKADDMTIYKAVCIRHTGKKHVKFEATFAVHKHGVGYVDDFFKEIK